MSSLQVNGMLLIVALGCGPVAAGDSQRRPNILFIAVDDLRPELGCYDVAGVHSPNIDRLARSGVLFKRAYCQLAVCNPSRVSIMTGLRPDTTRVWDLSTRFRNTIPDVVTMPQHFVAHGYRAESYGKIFHNPWPDNQSWSKPHAWPAGRKLWSDDAKERLLQYREKMKAEGRTASQISRMRAQATEIVDLPDEEHVDGAIAKQALVAMQRLAAEEQPFFLAAGFVRPHLPFVVPRRYWEMYDRESIPEAGNPFLPKDAPSFAMNTMYELRDYLDFDGTARPTDGALTMKQRRRLKHGYYAAISFIDNLVGQLLDGLEKHGLRENTIVVLWSDHGWKLGEHRSWCKQSNYEIDTRVPFIVRAPGISSEGQSSDALVELLDVYPTLCDLAGLPVPEQLEGVSLVPQLKKPANPGKPAAFSQFRRQQAGVPLMGYAMRTNRYRYIEWIDRRSQDIVATELYDHQIDPFENRNVAGLPDHRGLLQTLHKQLWDSLPSPPRYESPAGERPRITFVNRGQHRITLFWIRPDGTEQKVGDIAPGEQKTQNTTQGHKFRAQGPNGSTRVFTVQQQKQTITIRSKKTTAQTGKRKPNIVVCMADDWSWPHAGILGDPVVNTPNFDRIATEGVLFENAFVSTPSCTPSRLSLLTGQHHWRLKEGASLGGSLREEFEVYTDLLETTGFKIGRFGKGVWPSQHEFRNRDSFGERFKSFDDFLKSRRDGEPFCYWHGGQDPHRPYELGIGERSGLDPGKIRVPDCLPDNSTVRSDLADYLWEVQRFDREVGNILARLEEIGELDNTIFVVSGDNGMPFPRCKATLYDLGTRVPLAVRWGNVAKGGHAVADFVSLCDLAPTFLEAAGIKPPDQMTGRSLMLQMTANRSGQIESDRVSVACGVEKHVYLNPSRSLRNSRFLYILNEDSEHWPTGKEHGLDTRFDFAVKSWPTERGAFSFNVDPSPTKQLLRLQRSNSEVQPFARLAFAPRPAEELYDLRADAGQVKNVVDDPQYSDELRQMRDKLMEVLTASSDPRYTNQDELNLPQQKSQN